MASDDKTEYLTLQLYEVEAMAERTVLRRLIVHLKEAGIEIDAGLLKAEALASTDAAVTSALSGEKIAEEVKAWWIARTKDVLDEIIDDP